MARGQFVSRLLLGQREIPERVVVWTSAPDTLELGFEVRVEHDGSLYAVVEIIGEAEETMYCTADRELALADAEQCRVRLEQKPPGPTRPSKESIDERPGLL